MSNTYYCENRCQKRRIIQDDANGVVIDCRSGVEQMEDVQRYRKESVPKVLIRNRRKHFIPKGKVGH